ncbi:MAG: monovalent cation/hydrogen antiporter [Verrucomicrobiota bacterium]|jgi:CPA1 family monovalent cation:H+ antiporter
MNQAEIICTLLIVVAALAILAKKVALPYPVLLVIGGLALGFVPGLPAVQLDPDMVFLFLLPPLLYPAALFTSWRDFRANLSQISLLAIGLVLFTTAFVAVLAHTLTGLPWAAAFVLGAIISPTDAVAATAIANRLRVPQKIVTVLEGESLINDATALVAYRFAIVAIMSGRFSLSEASLRFILVALGGTGIGLTVGWLASHVQRRLDDPPVQITISLLTPFAAYIPAERLHVSGVLAVVAAGLFLGWRTPQILTSRTRLNLYVFWEMMVFLLNGLVFVLIGLQLPRILHALSGQSLRQLVWHGVLISCAAIVVRIAWVFTATYLPRMISTTWRKRDPYPAWRNVTIVAWTGMRGVVSLAAALALPLTLSNGRTFPGRDYILFITFCVILATLVLQGLSLPALIRRLGVVDDGLANVEERAARLKANEAALAYLREVDRQFPPDIVERLRAEYDDRIRQLEVCASTGGDRTDGFIAPSYQRLQQDALDVERRTIIQLRDEYVINDEVLRRIQSDLDHAEARLQARE